MEKILKITIKFDDSVDETKLLTKIKQASKEENIKPENIQYRVRTATDNQHNGGNDGRVPKQ